MTTGITNVWLPKKRGCGTKSRSMGSNVQCVIVEYDSHRSAAMARRRLIPERVELWGNQIVVEWATPDSCRKVNSLFPNTKQQIVFHEIDKDIACARFFELVSRDHAS
jgi:hypothetical protein